MKDGRKSNAVIADEVGMSEETVRRRKAALQADGIYEVVAVPNYRKLGYECELLIGMHVDSSRIWEVADEVAELNEVYRVLVTSGSFAIFVWIMTDSLNETVIRVRRSISSIVGVVRLTTFQWTATEPRSRLKEEAHTRAGD